LKSVPLTYVLRSWDHRIMRFFLDNSADAITGSPFAVAFSERIQPALRPFVDYKNEHTELAPEQTYLIALHFYCLLARRRIFHGTPYLHEIVGVLLYL